MKTPHVLSANDYKRIFKALQANKPDALVMTLGDYKIAVSVVSVGKDIKTVAELQRYLST